MAKKTSPRGGKRRTPQVSGVDLSIVSVSIESLHEDPANAKKHPEKNLAAIRASLQEFGQIEPLIVMAETNRVIGGNGRLTVMRELGWSECGVIFFRGSEAEARALAIALNRTGELGEWNGEVLKQTLAAIAADGFDVTKLAISDDDLAAIVGSALDITEPAVAAATKPAKRKAAAAGPKPEADDDVSDEIAERWEVLVKCPNKTSRSRLMKRLEGEGFDCRPIIA